MACGINTINRSHAKDMNEAVETIAIAIAEERERTWQKALEAVPEQEKGIRWARQDSESHGYNEARATIIQAAIKEGVILE